MSKRLDQLLKNIKVESEKLDRIKVEVYFNQVRNAFDEGDYNASSNLLDKILTRSDLSEKELLEANFLSGKVNYELGNYESAISFFELVSNPEIGEMYEESQKYITKIRIKQAVEIKRERDALREKLSNMKRYVRNTFLSLISIGTLVLGGFGISQFDCNGQEEQLSEEEDSKYNNNAKYCGNTIADTTLENALQVSQRINAYSSASLYSSHVRNIATVLSTSLSEETELDEVVLIPQPVVETSANEEVIEEELEIVEEETNSGSNTNVAINEDRDTRRERGTGTTINQGNRENENDEGDYVRLNHLSVNGMSNERFQRSTSCFYVIDNELYSGRSNYRMFPPSLFFDGPRSNQMYRQYRDSSISGTLSLGMEDYNPYQVVGDRLRNNNGEILDNVSIDRVRDGETVYIVGNNVYSVTNQRRQDIDEHYYVRFNNAYYQPSRLTISGSDTRRIDDGNMICLQNGVIYLRPEE